MDRIALVSCGRSALESWPAADESRYVATVGVNWAALLWRFDWLACCDPKPLDHPDTILPRIGVLTYGEPTPVGLRLIESNGLEIADVSPAIEGCSYTFPHALRFCLERWPGAGIDVYGLDMDDGPCLTGLYSRRRGSDMWARERGFVWDLVAGNLDRVELVGCKWDGPAR